MKRKNISNVRHPYYVIAPKVIEFGSKYFKFHYDSKDDKAPF